MAVQPSRIPLVPTVSHRRSSRPPNRATTAMGNRPQKPQLGKLFYLSVEPDMSPEPGTLIMPCLINFTPLIQIW